MKKLLIVMLFNPLFLCGCKYDTDFSVIKIGSVTLSIKGKSKFYLLANSIDSDVGSIVLNNGADTIHIEYGNWKVIDKGYRVGRTIFSKETLKRMISNNEIVPPSEEVFFSDFPEEDRTQNIDDPSYYKYDTINNLVGKLMLPKVSGYGYIGFYIPKLPDGKSFSIYGKNLGTNSQEETFRIIKSIRFNEK